MVHELRRRRETEADRGSARGGDRPRRETHQLRGVPELQDHLPEVRRPVLLHLRGRGRQQSVLPGGHTQLRRGAQRVLPQRVRTGPGVQLLQGVHRGGRDVLGRRDPGDEPDESFKTTAHAQLSGVSYTTARARRFSLRLCFFFSPPLYQHNFCIPLCITFNYALQCTFICSYINSYLL